MTVWAAHIENSPIRKMFQNDANGIMRIAASNAEILPVCYVRQYYGETDRYLRTVFRFRFIFFLNVLGSSAIFF